MYATETTQTGGYVFRGECATLPMPSQLTPAILQQLDSAIQYANQTGYSLSSLRDRIFGATPEAVSGLQKGSEAGSLSGQIEERFEHLLSLLRRNDALGETLNARF